MYIYRNNCLYMSRDFPEKYALMLLVDAMFPFMWLLIYLWYIKTIIVSVLLLVVNIVYFLKSSLFPDVYHPTCYISWIQLFSKANYGLLAESKWFSESASYEELLAGTGGVLVWWQLDCFWKQQWRLLNQIYQSVISVFDWNKSKGRHWSLRSHPDFFR